MKIRIVVNATNIKKRVNALFEEIKFWGIGLRPKTLQYLVNLSVSISFLSISRSTISFKTRPASNPKKAIKTALIISDHE